MAWVDPPDVVMEVVGPTRGVELRYVPWCSVTGDARQGEAGDATGDAGRHRGGGPHDADGGRARGGRAQHRRAAGRRPVLVRQRLLAGVDDLGGHRPGPRHCPDRRHGLRRRELHRPAPDADGRRHQPGLPGCVRCRDGGTADRVPAGPQRRRVLDRARPRRQPSVDRRQLQQPQRGGPEPPGGDQPRHGGHDDRLRARRGGWRRPLTRAVGLDALRRRELLERRRPAPHPPGRLRRGHPDDLGGVGADGGRQHGPDPGAGARRQPALRGRASGASSGWDP